MTKDYDAGKKDAFKEAAKICDDAKMEEEMAVRVIPCDEAEGAKNACEVLGDIFRQKAEEIK